MTKPRVATPEEAEDVGRAHMSRKEIDWTPYTDGRWWLVYEGTAEGDWMRAYERIKKTAGRWAARKGLARRARRRKAGFQVWVMFTALEES